MSMAVAPAMATQRVALTDNIAQTDNIGLTDDTGQPVPATPPQRIVALYGAFAELVVALDCGKRLVGRTDADASVPGLEMLHALPSVGTHLRPDPERIVALRPDMVLVALGRQDAVEQLARLRALGVPALGFSLRTVDDMLRVTRTLGTVLGVPDQTATLTAQLTARLDAVAARVATRATEGSIPLRVVFEVRGRNLLTAGSATLADDVIRRAGGVNAITSPRMIRLNEEALLLLDPDVYILQRGPMNPDPMPLTQRPAHAALRAVRLGRVLEVDEALFSRPGPRVVEAVELLERFLWEQD